MIEGIPNGMPFFVIQNLLFDIKGQFAGTAAEKKTYKWNYTTSLYVVTTLILNVMFSEVFGSLLAVFSALGVGAMILSWRFGDLDGKTVIIAALVLGMLSALLFTAETLAAAIEEKLSSASDFFGDLIEDIWT